MPTPPDLPGPGATAESYADGRDELNLADFPISVLQRQAPADAQGRKLDQVVYASSTYDPVVRRRVPQRVTLTTSSRYGLPTPADENVVLALLFTAKRANDFTEPRVHFSPHQLFRVMRWATNSRSYARLSQVLLRLKSLTILYENAWWDASGRRYEEEFATGIVAEYRLVKTKLRRKPDVLPPSYVHWSPQFFRSLSGGNLKKLDLDRLFALDLPTSQRMYRFLDKRFYLAPVVELDLREFACGHLGVTSTPNVAELKRRVAPAVAELEALGFIERAPAEDRYIKVRKGIWRIRFRRAGSPPVASVASASPPALPGPAAPGGVPERALIVAFYGAWAPGVRAEPTPQELDQARALVARHGAGAALELVAPVVALMRTKFPEARKFGASLPYFDEAARSLHGRRLREARDDEAARRRRAERDEADRRRAEDDAFFAAWSPRWDALPEPLRAAITAAVLDDHPYLDRPLLRDSRVATRLFLEELSRRERAASGSGE